MGTCHGLPTVRGKKLRYQKSAVRGKQESAQRGIFAGFHNVEIISLQYVEKVSEQVRGRGLILTLPEAPNSSS